jgi:hypothetical protein
VPISSYSVWAIVPLGLSSDHTATAQSSVQYDGKRVLRAQNWAPKTQEIKENTIIIKLFASKQMDYWQQADGFPSQTFVWL